MSVSLKTLTKPQRYLLAAVDAGTVWQRDNYTGVTIYILGGGHQQTRVSGKTWEALAGAGLVEFGPKPAEFRAPRPTAVTDKGKQVLAGETVNAADPAETAAQAAMVAAAQVHATLALAAATAAGSYSRMIRETADEWKGATS